MLDFWSRALVAGFGCRAVGGDGEEIRFGAVCMVLDALFIVLRISTLGYSAAMDGVHYVSRAGALHMCNTVQLRERK